jgi:hypothetical protein
MRPANGKRFVAHPEEKLNYRRSIALCAFPGRPGGCTQAMQADASELKRLFFDFEGFPELRAAIPGEE